VGNVWVFGIGVVTLIMLVVVNRQVLSRLRRGRTADAAAAVEPLSPR